MEDLGRRSSGRGTFEDPASSEARLGYPFGFCFTRTVNVVSEGRNAGVPR